VPPRPQILAQDGIRSDLLRIHLVQRVQKEVLQRQRRAVQRVAVAGELPESCVRILLRKARTKIHRESGTDQAHVGVRIELHVPFLPLHGDVADIGVDRLHPRAEQHRIPIEGSHNVAGRSHLNDHHRIPAGAQRAQQQFDGALAFRGLVGAGIRGRAQLLDQSSGVGRLAPRERGHLLHHQTPGPLFLPVTLVQQHRAQVELGQREDRRQIQMIVRIVVRVEQVGRIDQRHARRRRGQQHREQQEQVSHDRFSRDTQFSKRLAPPSLTAKRRAVAEPSRRCTALHKEAPA